MKDEQKSFPVRYMPMKAYEDDWLAYDIVDTTSEMFLVAARCYSLECAHLLAKALNEAEGYVYEP